jgi:hypothetical protein
MSLKSYLFGFLSISTAIFAIPSIAVAEKIATVHDRDSGVFFQVYLDDRIETTTTAAGRRQVSFWLGATADTKKSRAIASCNPYQVESDAYDMYLSPNGGGYPASTVIGKIARLACGKEPQSLE